MTITPEKVLAEVATLEEGKAIAASALKTAQVVSAKHGAEHATTKMFFDRYFAFAEALALFASKKVLAA